MSSLIIFLLFYKPNIDRSQQAVSVDFIQNSHAGLFPEKTKWPTSIVFQENLFLGMKNL
jgi:hypothetical protein